MNKYRKTSYSIYDIKYHLAWVTKYRKPVLYDDVAARARDIIREVCKMMDVEILKGHIAKDHVHILACFSSTVSIGIEAGAAGKRKVVAKVAERISAAFQTILMSSSAGSRIFYS
ncbi:MAG: IS200/IS605 family transposase [Desulfobacteraceae bacterium]|mgnify:FL=1|jgi:REP element-mobilizing transposase RayT|nr:IS200/IS605 family transposase [Desulfobacteraceae bacterium]